MIHAAILFIGLACPVAAQSAANWMKDGNVHYDRKEWEKALVCYQKAVKADPKSTEAQALVGSTFGQMKQWDEAVVALRKALEMEVPKGDMTLYAAKELGILLGVNGRLEESIQAFQEGLKVDPRNELCLRNIGVSYMSLGRIEEAVAVWEACLKVNPKQPTIREDVVRLKKEIEERRSPAPPAEPEPPPLPTPSTPLVAPLTIPPADPGRAKFLLEPLGGWAMAPEGVLLAVSIPSQGELIYYDTEKGEEVRRVNLDFRPGSMALQGSTLYVLGVGSSLVYALDFATGKPKREFRVPGDPLIVIAANPTRGLLYASTTREEIVSIDPASGAVTRTKARGQFLAVDPVGGGHLYAARTSPRDFDVEVEKNPDGTSIWYFDSWGYRARLRKYAISGKDLKSVASNDNAAVNGRALVLSPDGKRITVVGSSGWRGKKEGGGGYVSAVFDTSDLVTMLGQLELGEYPENIVYHPALNLGVALRSPSELRIFNSRSLVTYSKNRIQGAPRSDNETAWILFGARGSKILYWQMGDAAKREKGVLYFLPIDLTGEDRAVLDRAYPRAKGPGSPAAPTEVPKVLQLLNSARQMEKNGAPALALKYYKRIVEEHAGTPEAAEAARRIPELEKP